MPKSLPQVDLSAGLCCPPVAAGVVSEVAALDVALRLKALADPVRIKLLSMVLAASEEGLRNLDLTRRLELTDATISHHLGQLGRSGLVLARRQGTNTYYTANRDALGALARTLDPRCC